MCNIFCIVSVIQNKKEEICTIISIENLKKEIYINSGYNTFLCAQSN